MVLTGLWRLVHAEPDVTSDSVVPSQFPRGATGTGPQGGQEIGVPALQILTGMGFFRDPGVTGLLLPKSSVGYALHP